MRTIFILFFFIFTQFLHAQQSDFNKIDFQKADKIAERYKGEELFNLPILALRLTAQLDTEAERFRALYYWVTHNIRGDYTLMKINEQTRRKLNNNPSALHQWNKRYKKTIFTTLREEKKTLCTGYAYLLKELANLAGLECEIIHGYGKSDLLKFEITAIPNHSWNVIKIDGTWYLCDATWSSGFINMETYRFEFKYNDSFFLMEPLEFAKTHKPVDKQWTLLQGNHELTPQ
ncbi:transglutaminase domain-containing protein [Rasiella sp. SM2506]|uniref:transglutaminase domain-containing protein n=1 Tax=Rasiella sp. SM2506 TaxID=3423914 RepID=UPI003D7A31F0